MKSNASKRLQLYAALDSFNESWRQLSESSRHLSRQLSDDISFSLESISINVPSRRSSLDFGSSRRSSLNNSDVPRFIPSMGESDELDAPRNIAPRAFSVSESHVVPVGARPITSRRSIWSHLYRLLFQGLSHQEDWVRIQHHLSQVLRRVDSKQSSGEAQVHLV